MNVSGWRRIHCIFLSFNALGELCVCVHCVFYCTGTLLCNLAAIPYLINIIIIMVIENACNDRISDSTNSATSSFSAGTAPRTTLRGACDAPPNHIIGCCPLLVFWISWPWYFAVSNRTQLYVCVTAKNYVVHNWCSCCPFLGMCGSVINRVKSRRKFSLVTRTEFGRFGRNLHRYLLCETFTYLFALWVR